MKIMEGVDFIQGDIRKPGVLDQIFTILDGETVDLVLSDMAPHISGNKVRDQAQSLELIDCALQIASRCLRSEGRLVLKMFQGAGFEETVHDMRSRFAKVTLAKPPASRDRSRELYAVVNVE
jgi:23S rRNA (uridine2552-2'-O)-methyltransferase